MPGNYYKNMERLLKNRKEIDFKKHPIKFNITLTTGSP